MTDPFTPTPYGCRLGDVELVWAQNSKDFFFANSIVIHGSQPIVVDPSANFTYFESLATTQNPTRVLNTHYHSDHRALNSLFRAATFLSHREDAPALRSLDELQRRLDSNPNSPYSQWAHSMWQQMHIHETPVDIELQDGDIVEADRHRVEVIHTPGHTPGHIALLVDDIGLLFTADIDLTPFGPWYANEVSDIDQFKASVHKVRQIEVDHYVTSHGQRIFEREKFLEKLERFESYFAKRDDEILAAIRTEPHSAEELSEHGIIYRKVLLQDPLKAYFSLKMIQKHCERLVRLGELVFDGLRYHLARS